MKLNPLEIRKHEFPTRFRGYDPEEVDGFLQVVSQQWQELTDEMRRLEARIEEQAAKLTHYAKVEEALEQALETAREGARQRLETADQRAALTVEDATRRAAALLADAETRASALRDSAEREARDLLADTRMRASEAIAGAESRLASARNALAEAGLRRSEIVVRLRSFLTSELELLAGFEGESLPATDLRPGAIPLAVPNDEASETVWVTGSADAARDFRDVDDVEMEAERPPEAEYPAAALPEVEDLVPSDPSPLVLEPTAPVEDELPVAAAEPPVGTAFPDPGPTSVGGGSWSVEEAGGPPGAPEGLPEAAASDDGGEEFPPATTPAASPALPASDPVVDPPEEARPRRSSKPRTSPTKQTDLMDAPGDVGSASDEIRKIRRILEDLDR